VIVHEDRLVSALNKYWRPLTREQYGEELSLKDIQNAVEVCGMPKETSDWVFEVERDCFEMF
jgi:hypothetical protein